MRAVRFGRSGMMLVGTVAAFAATAGVAHADPSCSMVSATSEQCVYSTAGASSFAVPTGVTSLDVVAVGAAGGTAESIDGGPPGGSGASVTDSAVPVTGGVSLTVEVGAPGARGTSGHGGAGGAPGGGNAGDTGTASLGGSGGGGGYSGLLAGGTPLVIAGGGGGGGDNNGGNSTGGFGGDADTGSGGQAGTYGVSYDPGLSPSQNIAGGGGGVTSGGSCAGGTAGVAGYDGSAGGAGSSLQGGAGGASNYGNGHNANENTSGAGGGGGYCGGGGSGGAYEAGGGGGGSSYGAGPGLSAEQHASGAASVTITYTVPADATMTGVQCGPAAPAGVAQMCTATVTDTTNSGRTPTGTVEFSATGSGSYGSGGDLCTLSGGSCSVSYTPTTYGPASQTVTASYLGNTAYAVSRGQGTVTLTGADVVFAFSGPSNAADGSTFTETVTTTDNGPDPTPTKSSMEVNLPAKGSGLTATKLHGGHAKHGQVSWAIPKLADGQTVTKTITFRVSEKASGQVTLSGSTAVPSNDSRPSDAQSSTMIALGSAG